MATASNPSETLELEVLTPKGRVLSMVADEVTAPGVKGEFGVLPGHLPLLTALRTGIVTVRHGANTKQLAIGPGFAEVGEGKILILTDETIERAAIDPVIVRKALSDVQDEARTLTTGNSALEERELASRMRGLIAKENWLAVQLELYGDPPPATMHPHQAYGVPPATPDETP